MYKVMNGLQLDMRAFKKISFFFAVTTVCLIFVKISSSDTSHDAISNDYSNNFDDGDILRGKLGNYNTKISPHTQAEVTLKTGVKVLKQQCSEPRTDEFNDLQEKWRGLLVSDNYDETDAVIVKHVEALSKEAECFYKTLATDNTRVTDKTRLWPIRSGDTPSADLTTQFRNILKLTLAYGTKGTKYYKDTKILSTVKECLDFMLMPGLYSGKKYRGNWWDWQIGVPQNFIDVLMIIKNELPSQAIQQYTEVISNYVPDPYVRMLGKSQRNFTNLKFPSKDTSGANRVDLAKSILGLGILQKNNTKISVSLDSVEVVLKPVTKGDGFYLDGSFIQHKNVPYTGLYGDTLVKGLAEMLYISKGSKFQMASDLVKLFLDTVERVFLPLIYRGELIATVNGRSISRSPDKRIDSPTLYILLMVTKCVSDRNRKRLKEFVKYWMRQSPDYYLSHATNYNELLMALSLLNDSTVPGDTVPFVGTKMFASADRFVQCTPSYMLGISLYSKRISAFEAGNKENKRGWHTADGALYLYNNDGVQFMDAYWPTVDPYRIPGTTVDTQHLKDEETSWQWHTFTSAESWVGGVAYSKLAVVGMALNKSRLRNNGKKLTMNLRCKKSWFVVDGQIVALGAGITGTTQASIETIVENRLLNNLHSYEVYSNHGKINGSKEIIQADWLFLGTNHQESSIGYYFPYGENVNIISETRNGTFKDINEPFQSSKLYTGNYHKFIIDHGNSPVDAKYAYVLLPAIGMSELKLYTDRKPVKVLENSANIQAVELVNEGYLGVNVWGRDGGEIVGISSNKPVSLMRQTKGQGQTYVLSDPTQSNKVITIKIPTFNRILQVDDGIYYDLKENAFVADFRNAAGASKQFTVYNLHEN